MLHGLDPESIDHADIYKMKKNFTSQITDFETDKDQYKIYYVGIGLVGAMFQILQMIGVVLDTKIIMKIEEAIKNDKMTYIKFFSGLESFADPSIEGSIKTAIEYSKELGFHEYHTYRVSLETQHVLLILNKPDVANRNLGIERLKELEEIYTKKKDDYEFIEEKLKTIQNTLLFIGMGTNDMAPVMKYGPAFIEEGFKAGYLTDEILQVVNIVYGLLIQSGKRDKVIDLCKILLENAKPPPGVPFNLDYEKAISL